jgi:hypothetical protein
MPLARGAKGARKVGQNRLFRPSKTKNRPELFDFIYLQTGGVFKCMMYHHCRLEPSRPFEVFFSHPGPRSHLPPVRVLDLQLPALGVYPADRVKRLPSNNRDNLTRRNLRGSVIRIAIFLQSIRLIFSV